jgi:glycosyltransferase involved in cell wall biosynthesis
MACGTPVAASRAGSLPEVVGNAGLFFDPKDPLELKNTLAALLANAELRTELQARSLKQAENFNWFRSAEILRDIFCKVARS